MSTLKKYSICSIIVIYFFLSAGKLHKADNISFENINFETIKGEKLLLSEFDNKFILVDFWATWCGPCIKSIPKLIEITDTFTDDLVVLGVSMDRELSHEDMGKFIERYKINYHVGFFNKDLKNAFPPIKGIPTMYLMDPNGKVVMQKVGFDPSHDLKDEISKHIAVFKQEK